MFVRASRLICRREKNAIARISSFANCVRPGTPQFKTADKSADAVHRFEGPLPPRLNLWLRVCVCVYVYVYVTSSHTGL